MLEKKEKIKAEAVLLFRNRKVKDGKQSLLVSKCPQFVLTLNKGTARVPRGAQPPALQEYAPQEEGDDGVKDDGGFGVRACPHVRNHPPSEPEDQKEHMGLVGVALVPNRCLFVGVLVLLRDELEVVPHLGIPAVENRIQPRDNNADSFVQRVLFGKPHVHVIVKGKLVLALSHPLQ